jgi:hypothetical protein
MDVKEILDNVEDWLNNDSSLPHQDFDRSRLLRLLNMSYRKAFRYAMIHAPKDWQQVTVDITWPANQNTFELPSGLAQKNIIDIRNVTSDDVGYQMPIGHSPGFHEVFWKDYKTLQYGVDGYPNNQVLRVLYRAEPEELITESQEPSLVPPYHRDVLILGTCLLARQQADESYPPAWRQEYEQLLLGYTKLMSRGRPEARVPGVLAQTPSVYYAWSELR